MSPDHPEGFLVEVTARTLHKQTRRILFAVGLADPDRAVAAVKKFTGGLDCAVHVRCRFSSRALAQLGVQANGVVQLDSLSDVVPI